MHYSVLNRATVRVADTRDVSGRVTAKSINNGSRAERKSSVWRAFGLTIFCSVVSVGVLASLTPVSAFADPGGIPAEIAQLKAQVAALQSQVEALQDQLAAVQSNNALALGPYVSVVMGLVDGVNGPHIYFTGTNIHIVSGHTTTADTVTGLGNLIIGYDEASPSLGPGDRGGSHNLVIGRFNRFTKAAFGGIAAGERNTISNEAASVSGGENNTASGLAASVSGGVSNTASREGASVSGGNSNMASGEACSVSGGASNIASGHDASVSGGNSNMAGGEEGSSVSGGLGNTASGIRASVSGGLGNSASGAGASVSGGARNIASGNPGASVSGGDDNMSIGQNTSVSGGSFNVAAGPAASVTGGEGNTAGRIDTPIPIGINTVVIGGQNVTDYNNFSIAPQPPFP